ncbi:tRNA pseudouridine(38-40) synthase TruA [Pararhizobium sp. IMCC21322]|uniref:tRNA pseudouridine(38-40) synthase TruA n=1 Tax=Pararhizobium sp. IMCC21322 TaxID=3067903 RepID=UPI0027425D31|nr:tRNA pseudouridine(38-40) synthase TruA [Pararhizobium sp. IMCC21322]
MPRYKLTIEYDGAPYFGWQRQPNRPSVQATLEQAVLKFCSEEVTVRGAGRTDAGVHALGQIAHLDLSEPHSTDTVRDALNFHLKREQIAILGVDLVGDDFDARFSATKRHYLYRIQSRRARSILKEGRVWWVPKQLDADAMHVAAQLLVGHHDFTTFRATKCQAKSPVKTLDKIDVRPEGLEIHIRVSAKSFLHNQIRSFAGSLRLVGEGAWTADDLQAALDEKNRRACGPVAPPWGLYLQGVDYTRPDQD